MNVSLFVTCLTDLFAPQVGLATVKVLEHFGCTVDFPQAQTCCGQPMFNNGYPDEARRLAQRMVRVFAASRYVVTPSASCCVMIREQYPALLAGEPLHADAVALAGKTYELVEFLTKILKADVSGLALPQPASIACHYTCHSRGLGLSATACLELVKRLGNTRVLPLERSEQCCGFGGTFATKYPDISGAIVRDKVDCGNRSGAEVMLVNDAGCAMNIGGACHRYGGRFRIQHIAEVLASAIETAPQPRTSARGAS